MVYQKVQPNIIFHLAAQPLVIEFIRTPLRLFPQMLSVLLTYLNARLCKSVKAIVNITTDKCYENKEWAWPYRETDRLGGQDPYSASKACSELVTQSFYKSFLTIGSDRQGCNVIVEVTV